MGRATVIAFFAALREGDEDAAESFVARGGIDSAALRELARLGEAVEPKVSAQKGSQVKVKLRSTVPLQNWAQCSFWLRVSKDGKQITGQTSCPAPPPPG